MEEKRIISEQDFYTAFQHLREMGKTLRSVEKALGAELGESEIGKIYDHGFEIFTTLIFGTDYIDECIYDALESDELTFLMEPEEGFNKDYSNGIPCTISYDQYYEYFALRKYGYPEA